MADNVFFSSRPNAYKSRRENYDWKYKYGDLRDLILRASQVKGLDSLMLGYPEHFEEISAQEINQLVDSLPISISGINMRYPEEVFLNGCFTNPDKNIRTRAVQMTKEATDQCRALNSKYLVLWLAYDGFDYPFQMDYQQVWDWSIESIKEICQYAPDIKFSIEYKISDPRRFSLLGNAGSTLLFIEEANEENLGVTLDLCHLLMAGEDFSFTSYLCHKANKLDYIHLNDGYGSLDDGLMVGSVNFTRTLELIYYLKKWEIPKINLYFDTFPIREDPVIECSENIRRIKKLFEIAENLDEEDFNNQIQNQDAISTNRTIWDSIYGF